MNHGFSMSMCTGNVPSALHIHVPWNIKAVENLIRELSLV